MRFYYITKIMLQTQRKVCTGEQYGTLTDEQIEKLDALGMAWSGYRDLSWQRNLAAAQAYYMTFGNLNVNIGYVTEDGIHLRQWISNLRTVKKNDSKKSISLRNAFLSLIRSV